MGIKHIANIQMSVKQINDKKDKKITKKLEGKNEKRKHMYNIQGGQKVDVQYLIGQISKTEPSLCDRLIYLCLLGLTVRKTEFLNLRRVNGLEPRFNGIQLVNNNITIKRIKC